MPSQSPGRYSNEYLNISLSAPALATSTTEHSTVFISCRVFQSLTLHKTIDGSHDVLRRCVDASMRLIFGMAFHHRRGLRDTEIWRRWPELASDLTLLLPNGVKKQSAARDVNIE